MVQVQEVVPTVSAAVAYTAEDQVGGIQTLDLGIESGKLVSLSVSDKGKQKAALVVFLFDELPTVASVDNGAIDVADAELDGKCIGTVAIAAADYQDVSGGSVATKTGINLLMKSLDTKIYAVAKTTGTPTYVSTSDLRFRYGIER